MLKRKVEDNGATRAITQFFFDNDLYESYVEQVRRAGIYIPIVPGILPVHNFGQVANSRSVLALWCRPGWRNDLRGSTKDPQTHALVAAAVAAEQVMDLVERGVGDFHFYTMNRADLAFAICHMIGIRGEVEKAAPAAAALIRPAPSSVLALRANPPSPTRGEGKATWTSLPSNVTDWRSRECCAPPSPLVGEGGRASEVG